MRKRAAVPMASMRSPPLPTMILRWPSFDVDRRGHAQHPIGLVCTVDGDGHGVRHLTRELIQNGLAHVHHARKKRGPIGEGVLVVAGFALGQAAD